MAWLENSHWVEEFAAVRCRSEPGFPHWNNRCGPLDFANDDPACKARRLGRRLPSRRPDHHRDPQIRPPLRYPRAGSRPAQRIEETARMRRAACRPACGVCAFACSEAHERVPREETGREMNVCGGTMTMPSNSAEGPVPPRMARASTLVSRTIRITVHVGERPPSPRPLRRQTLRR